MAESTLRAYLKEIDDLIEHDQLDEAIAHCRHILGAYPKHLETYRLLGKAYLEAKRFGDAADIFQRVLSAVPDDFVAHVGMSIVREDEGNLDASIWHMERAFETNPANPAIQQELRRLIGRRDGIEPHKVRLTRGALARMYAHGELYPQAVAELRAALQEDPERADLQVLLAGMHWRTGQRAESAQACQQVLDKLPYCREANRILAAAFQAGGRHEEASPHLRRLAALDPYAAFLENAMADPQTVDAGTVRLERIEWSPGQTSPLSKPDWASSMGVDLRRESEPLLRRAPAAGPMPSWLQEIEAEPEAAEPAASPAAAPAPAQDSAGADEDIPDWMRAAGWGAASGEAVEGPVAFSDDELAQLDGGAPPAPPASPDASDEALAPGELPDWLRDIAPREGVPAAPAEAAPTWDEGPAFEAGPAAGPPPAEEASPAQAAQESIPEPEPTALPTWLDTRADGASDTIVAWLGDRTEPPTGELPAAPAPEPAALPDWMRTAGMFDDTGPTEPPPERDAFSLGDEPTRDDLRLPGASPETIPSWLSGVADAAAQQEPLQPEEVARLRERRPAEPDEPEWLAGLGEPPTGPTAAEAPDWLRGILEPGAQPAAGQEAGPASEEPDWLRAQPETGARRVLPQPSEPDWLRGLAEAPAEESAEAIEPGLQPPPWLDSLRGEAEAAAGAEAPDWMAGELDRAPAEPIAVPTDEAADWLRRMTPEPAREDEREPAEEVPDWAAAVEGLPTPDWMAPDTASAAAPARPESLEVEPEPEPLDLAPEAADQPLPIPSGEMDEDDVFQWLEGLAARAATEEEARAVEAEAVEADQAVLGPAAGPIPEEPEAGLDWLERLAAQRGIDAEIEPLAPAPSARAETPDWMQLEAEPAEVAEEADGVPIWLEDAARYEAERDTTPLTAEDAARLERLAAAQAMAEAREAEAPAAAESVEAEEPPADWLAEIEEGLTEPAEAVPQPEPAAEETPAAPRRPATSELEIPGWLRAAAQAAPPEPPAPPAEPEPQPADEVPAPAGPAPKPVVAHLDETPSAELRVPDWLRMAADAEPELAPESAPTPLPPAVAPEAPASAAEAEVAAPDWLAAAAAAEGQPTVAYEEPAPAAPPEPEPAPIAAVEPAPTAAPPEAAEPAGVPDWLQVAAQEQAATAPAPEPALPVEEPTPAPERIEVEAEVATPAFEAVEPVEAEFEHTPLAAAPPPEPEPEPAPEPEIPAWLPTPAAAEAAIESAAPQPSAAPAPPPPAPTRTPAGWPTRGPGPQPPAPAGWPRYHPPGGAEHAGWAFPGDAGRGSLEAELEASVPEWLRPPLEAAPPPPLPPAPPPQQPVPEPVPAPASSWVPEVAAPQPEVRPARRGGGRAKGAAASPGEVLNRARRALASGDLDAALRQYGQLIRRRNEVEAVIEDLRAALGRAGAQPAIWQALGDAYMRSDRLPEAIEAYRRGLEAV